ncbi:MAG TPA: sigma-70 family RNA polymerase sigma factor [Polyangia bacterium]|jgi:RNA polymerase sigma-70 factor (ECF subfamily)|nr:sigma-70 family RNA polymerase sigma factor [Polyangia bacterium]
MGPDHDQDVLAALDRVVREQRAALAGLARRQGLGAEDALDCVHDAFCTFLQLALRGELAVGGDYAALLAGIVVNGARNKRRRHHLARPHDAIGGGGGDGLAPYAVEPYAGGPSTETLVAHAEECVRLRGCVARLCKTQRTVVMMRMLEERAGEDVAAAMGVTRGHVDVLLHRAKASLLVCMMER